MTTPTLTNDALTERLKAALEAAPPEAFAPDGWTLAGVGLRFLMGRDVPVVALAKDGRTLCFIVTPTDPSARVYKRTNHLDVVYFSEDVADDEQQGIYDRYRGTIDHFVSWLTAWDAEGGGAA